MKSKHLLDLRKRASQSLNQNQFKTDNDYFQTTTASGEIMEAARSDLFSTEPRLTRPTPKFSIEPSWLADLKMVWRLKFNRQRRPDFKVDLHQPDFKHFDSPVFRLAYNAIAYFGWFLEKLYLSFWWLVKQLKNLVLSPIKYLDVLLDILIKLIGLTLKWLLLAVLRGLDAAYLKARNWHWQPPYLWPRKLGTFMLLSALALAPIKLFFEVPKIISARQEVLGLSTRAFGYLNLFNELRGYVPVAQIAREFAGFAGPRRYLLVFQNNAELRPTGGFLGSYAQLDVDRGQILDLQVPTGGFYDLKGYIQKTQEAPKPFHVFSPYWQIWNANWFADFPTSAKQLSEMYENSSGPTVDGIVAMTPDVIEDLLALTGPIELPAYDTVISADNFRRQTQLEVEFEYDKEANTPKAIIGDLAPMLLDKTLQLAESDRLRELLAVLDQALAEKQLLLFSFNQDIQKLIIDLAWGGSLRRVPGDYLQLVHTNIGGGKTDLVIQDEIIQTINIEDDGSVINQVRLTRTHQGRLDDIFENHDNLDYLRFYVPADSRLLSAEGFTQDELSDRFKTSSSSAELDPDLAGLRQAVVDLESGTDIFEESGLTVFGNWLGLKPGQTKSVVIRYQPPANLSAQSNYQIYWQKQSGTKGVKLKVSINLSPDKQIVNWLPKDSHVNLLNDQQLTYSNDLRVDRYLSFSFK